MVTSEISKYFYLIKSPPHQLPLPTTTHLILKCYEKERRTKPCYVVRLFRSPSSVPWLDKWLVIITLVTLAIAILRTFVHSFLFRL